jgi:hypothetical protein
VCTLTAHCEGAIGVATDQAPQDYITRPVYPAVCLRQGGFGLGSYGNHRVVEERPGWGRGKVSRQGVIPTDSTLDTELATIDKAPLDARGCCLGV